MAYFKLSTEVSVCLQQKLSDRAWKRFICYCLVIKRYCLFILAGYYWVIAYIGNEWLTGKNVEVIGHHYHHHHHHHPTVCFTTGLYALPNRVLCTMQSSASSFNFQYPLFYLRSPGSCLLLLPRLLVPSSFSSVTCFRRQFLRNVLPIQLASIF